MTLYRMNCPTLNILKVIKNQEKKVFKKNTHTIVLMIKLSNLIVKKINQKDLLHHSKLKSHIILKRNLLTKYF